MSISISTHTDSALKQIIKDPNIVLEINGVPFVFGAVTIYDSFRIIDDEEEIGDPEVNPNAFYIGGKRPLRTQKNLISFEGGTTTSIRQQLNIDKGEGSSVSSLTISLIDDGYVTQLLTPGEIVDDLLSRKCVVYMAPSNSLSWPEDYVPIFRGIISDIVSDAGKSNLTITSPDSKKRSTVFKNVETKLNGAINASATTIILDSTLNILQKVLGPDASYDSSFESYVRIDDELIRFDTISGNQLLGCTRAQFNTVAASHADNANVSTRYRLTGSAMPLALKFMASGIQGYYYSEITPKAFGQVDAETVANAVYFEEINVAQKYGVVVGDYFTSTGAANGANNVTLREVLEVNQVETGSYIVLGGAALVVENNTTAEISFRSQYDTLPDGLRMGSDEIDVDEHLRIDRLFLSGVEYDFHLKEEVDGNEFLEKEIYLPAAAYSIPRKARSSVGYHIGPIPGISTPTFDATNLKKPSKIKMRRSIAKQFYNEILYKYEEDYLEDRFKSGYLTIAADSKVRITSGNKTLIITAKGMRDALSGDNIAQVQSTRRLNRYKFAAEVIQAEVFFEVGFASEIGDIIIFDASELMLPNTKTAQKGFGPRFFEVQNKTLDLKTGNVQLELVDTNFDGAARYALIGPSSKVKIGTSTTSFEVKPSYYTNRYGDFEYKKWTEITPCAVRVRSEDFSQNEVVVLSKPVSNTFTVSALSFTPTEDMIVELAHYDDLNTTEKIHLLYGFMRDTVFADSSSQYVML